MFRLNRFWALVFVAVGLLATLLLATSLTGTRLAPGQPFPFGTNLTSPIQTPVENIPGGQIVLVIFRIIFVFAWLMLPVIVIYLIISPKARKQLLQSMARVLPFILLLLILGPHLRDLFGRQDQTTESGGAGFPGGLPFPPSEIPTFDPNPPSWLVIGGSLVIAVIIIAIATSIGMALWRNWRRPLSKVQLLAEEAQEALDLLQAGEDLKNTIIRCYAEMSRVVKEQRGVQRAIDMTPIEFESQLVGLGLPADSVHDLTRVFQDVRYGDHDPGEREERQAILSLSAIVEACRSAA